MARKNTNNSELLGFLTDIVSNIYSANRTLNSICDFFKADAGCLWELNRQSDNRTFTLSAMHNRPDLVEIIEEKSKNRTTSYKIKYNISNDKTISSQIFKSKTSVFGSIGSIPFSGIWLKKEHTFGLKKLGMSYICLIPIFDFSNKPIASLSLYSKKRMNFNEKPFLEEFSKFFSSLWISSHIKMETLDLESSTMRHEITGNLIPLKSIISNLNNYSTLIEAAGNERVKKQFSDINRKLNSIDNTLKDSNIKDRIARNRYNAYFVNFQSNLNSITQPLISEVRKSIVQLNSIIYPRSDLRIYIHPNDFENLFRNLITNAIKYSIRGSTIRIVISERNGGLNFTISNISRALEKSEWKLVWEPRFRGTTAHEGEVDGDGLGMHVAKVICQTYGFSYRFYQQPLRRTQSKNVWSRVKIAIPKDMVR